MIPCNVSVAQSRRGQGLVGSGASALVQMRMTRDIELRDDGCATCRERYGFQEEEHNSRILPVSSRFGGIASSGRKLAAQLSSFSIISK